MSDKSDGETVDSKLTCPYCSVLVNLPLTQSEVWPVGDLNGDARVAYAVGYGHCPACKELVVLLRRGAWELVSDDEFGQHSEYFTLADLETEEVLYPKFSTRRVEPEVPERARNDFLEACAVLQVSPKASAAISRRLVQDILRDRFKIVRPSLAQEIDDFLALADVPTYLAGAIDAVRNIGNFAAHPLKDTQTGTIIDVEPGEAEWLLDVVESLLDFAFVQPVRLAARKQALNAKLQALGKPLMKE